MVTGRYSGGTYGYRCALEHGPPNFLWQTATVLLWVGLWGARRKITVSCKPNSLQCVIFILRRQSDMAACQMTQPGGSHAACYLWVGKPRCRVKNRRIRFERMMGVIKEVDDKSCETGTV